MAKTCIFRLAIGAAVFKGLTQETVDDWCWQKTLILVWSWSHQKSSGFVGLLTACVWGCVCMIMDESTWVFFLSIFLCLMSIGIYWNNFNHCQRSQSVVKGLALCTDWCLLSPFSPIRNNKYKEKAISM